MTWTEDLFSSFSELVVSISDHRRVLALWEHNLLPSDEVDKKSGKVRLAIAKHKQTLSQGE